MPPSAPELPHDLAVEVLLRLPVKSLVRFKSVCKSWRSLIESPDFISDHLNRSAGCGDGNHSNGARSVIFKYRSPSTEEYRVALLSGQTLEHNTPVGAPPHLHSQDWRIVGSRNGVVCLSHGTGYLLWNPATREYRVLPECLIYSNVYDGFGYDSAADDYRIVRVAGGFLDHRGCARVEVFALSEGSWREISALLSDWHAYHYKCVSLGGFLYWALSHCILSFDLRHEVFRRVCYPGRPLTGKRYHKRLSSSEESLCLIVFDYTVDDMVLELWVMDGGPGKESWTKRFSSAALIGILNPLGCGLNGGITVEKIDGMLAICEAGKESIRDFPVKGVRDCHFYIESLVRVIR